jgi:hypothetical protein
MESEERSFPLTRLNSGIVAVAYATKLDVNNKSASTSEEKQSKLRRILIQIITALGNSAESRQFFLLNHSSERDTDKFDSNRESEPELDSCSL